MGEQFLNTPDSLKAYVLEKIPNLIKILIDEGRVVDLRAGTASVNLTSTHYIGAIVQVACAAGAKVIIFAPDVVSIDWEADKK